MSPSGRGPAGNGYAVNVWVEDDGTGMSRTFTICVAEYVPLSNKGEEAIIRGIEDLVRSQGYSVRLAVMGREAEISDCGGITVFPNEWVYRCVGRRISPGKFAALLALQALKLRVGMLGTLGNLAFSHDPRHGPMREYFDDADCILVGHDGIFGIESCGVIHAARKAGKRVGIFGAGVAQYHKLAPLSKPLYRRAVAESDFCFFRERNAYEYMRAIGCDPAKLRLAPDPAFAMNPAPPQDVQAFLEGKEWYRRARQAGKTVVCATVSQKDVLLARPFAHRSTPAERRALHVKYLAEVFDRLIGQRDVLVVFLPHSLEPGPRNDVQTARDVTAAVQAGPESCCVMDDDLPARMLKGIIKECDFLVGQRAHSLIGSASVATPFVALTASNDRRTHDILGEMVGCEEQMVDMDLNDPAQAAERIVQAIDRREELRSHLVGRMAELRRRLEEMAQVLTA